MPQDTADLVIVGAGTIGGWAAVFAAEQDAGRVVVLDAGTVGAGASSRAAGIVRTQGGTATAVDLARWTTAFYRGQHERYGIDSGFRTLGYLILAFNAADEAAARERLAMQHERGLDSRWVDPGEAAALLSVLDPARITGATYCAEDGAIDPPRNVLAYTVALKAAGVDLRERTPATGLRIEGGSVTGVVTAAGTIATERVILAGGVGQGALTALTGGPAAPVGGARHQIAVTSPHSALAERPLPMGFELATGLYWRQEEGGILFGMSNPVEQPGEAREVDWDHLRTIRARLGELMPVTYELNLRRVWAATIDYTPDHLPILGQALGAGRTPIGGVTVASPGGHGMMWGPAVARIAADLALRGTSEVTDASLLGPDRFDEHGASTLATDPIALPFPETVGS